ncbi:NACHT domain-containing protein [Saccharothrix luteola]|uniref:NACHT domain-containing protein n=1 Tax=Saccharothrix luteola TaxID=2893018 RepID=UPI001E2C8165|nr:NACHT domain-containing protein [Saccharothrix luteola]MCC8244226.1 NACHT domain-containing protein [Saccharothrix luteola]
MVDPLQIAAGAFAGRAATRVINSLLGPENASAIAATLDEAFYSIEDSTGETLAILTEQQFADIESFLETKEVGSLLQSWAVLKITGRNYDDQEKILSGVKASFVRLAERRCEDQDPPWSSYASEVWSLITTFVDSAAPVVKSFTVSSEDHSDLLARFSTGAEVLKGGRSAAPRYIRDLVDIFASPSRLMASRNGISDIRRATEDAYRELTLSHAHDEYRIEVDRLYVDRTLSAHHGDGEYESDFLLSAHNGIPRILVIGDPGAGKSTLVHHTAYKVIQTSQTEVAPILVQCRDYAANSWGTPITDYITTTLEVGQSIEIDERALIDLLTLGGAYVIFDGVDEIIDLTRRRTFIRQIEAFGRRFPYVPILATARRVGYSRARFNDHSFQVFELNEFSDIQVREYAEKWFGVTRRDAGEMEAFLRETTSIADIRGNPLMLSLLCTLYRARGFIPRNRRQVYRECSELLFQRWDAMRQIEQPFDHRQYGQRLMQELARFFYKSQSAQGGLEEQQLVKIIAIFFRDTASIDPPEDDIRAQQFVDFCADRAWLLSAKGYNSRGNRLFAFTHRTFMEFYAAECLVRLAQSVSEIADMIIDAFESDASSVVPDVMVQAVDDKYDRGAEQVLQHLLQRGRTVASYRDKYLSLCLRIVNSSPMSRAVSQSLPDRVSEYWRSMLDVGTSYDSSTAFFELYRDPRARMVDAALRSVETQRSGHLKRSIEGIFASQVCMRWARFEALGVTSYFEPEWADSISPVFDGLATLYLEKIRLDENYLAQTERSDTHSFDLSRHDIEKIDAALADYFVATARATRKQFNVRAGLYPRLIVPTFGSASPGSLLDTFCAALVDGHMSVSDHLVDATKWHTKRAVKHGTGLRHVSAMAVVLEDVLAYWPQFSQTDIVDAVGASNTFREFGLWLMFALYEAGEFLLHDAHRKLDGMIGLDALQHVFATRDSLLGIPTRHRARALNDSALADLLHQFSPWALDWVKGTLALTFDDSPSSGR